MRLYQQGTSTKDISETQDALQEIQRSQHGWAYADAFLQNPNELVRFFGALTFVTKFNKDWQVPVVMLGDHELMHLRDTVDEENATAIYDRVLYWFVQSVGSRDSILVIKKLCSALVAYYLRPSVTWNRIVLHLAKRLTGGVTNSGDLSDDGFATCAKRLDEEQLCSMLWFVETLVHDLAQADTSDLQGYEPFSAQLPIRDLCLQF